MTRYIFCKRAFLVNTFLTIYEANEFSKVHVFIITDLDLDSITQFSVLSELKLGLGRLSQNSLFKRNKFRFRLNWI